MLVSFDRFDEAREVVGQSQARKLDGFFFRATLFQIASARGDGQAMRAQLELMADKDGPRTSHQSPPTSRPPKGIPDDYKEHIRLMGDMMVLAFQADLTRIATFMFANEGSDQSYTLIGVPEGHHDLSHHRNDPKKHEKIVKINTFHMEQFAYVLGTLKSIKEGDGTLLDNSMIVYGSGIGDGNRHNHDDLPDPARRQGGRHDQDRPPREVSRADPDEQPLPLDARPDRCPGGQARRQRRPAVGARGVRMCLSPPRGRWDSPGWCCE